MKSAVLSLVLWLLLMCSAVTARNAYGHISTPVSDTTENYLVMKAHVRKSLTTANEKSKEEYEWIDSALITIFQNNIPFSEIWTNKKGKCSFKLALNKVYTIEVSKPGYVTKIVEVNTKVHDQKELYSFEFDIDIFEEIKGLDVKVLQKPIARVSYNFLEERFNYDQSYTSKINGELKKMYKSYYQLQKTLADSLEKTAPPKPPQGKNQSNGKTAGK